MKLKQKNARKAIIKKLDALVSQIVRFQERACITCGGTEYLQNGHLFSRRHHATRWDIDSDGNCHTQCGRCNIRHNKDQSPYIFWYVEKFGKEKFEELRARHNAVTDFKEWQLRELYSQLLTVWQTMEEQNV